MSQLLATKFEGSPLDGAKNHTPKQNSGYALGRDILSWLMTKPCIV